MVMKTFGGVVVVLAAAGGIAAGEPSLGDALGITVTATSTLAGKAKTYDAWHPLAPDPLHTQFWCEGKPDEGIGEALVITLANPTKVDSLTIRAGVWRSEWENGVQKWKEGELFRANNIVTGIDVITDDGRTKAIVLPEERKDVEVAIGGGPVKQVRLQLTKIVRGKMNDSCISEVQIHTTPETALVLGADRAAIAALAPTFTKAWSGLKDCDEATLRSLVRYPVAYRDVLHKAKYRDAKALLKACKALMFSSFTNDETPAFKVVAEAPAAVTLRDDTLEWHLALDGGVWKLTSLEDGTP